MRSAFTRHFIGPIGSAAIPLCNDAAGLIAPDRRCPHKVALRGHTNETAAMMPSKLYARFLVLVSIFVMAAVGMLILVVMLLISLPQGPASA